MPDVDPDDPTGWFEPLYARAEGDPSAVPWAALAPHPLLVDWLDALDGGVAGLTALVVGCGLGDDAAELARRGAVVTGFDVSETAVGWAQERFPDLDLRVAALPELPEAWVRAFDLVVEVRTLQSLPARVRGAAAAAIGRTLAPRGLLVVVTLLATSDAARRAAGGPPWPLAPADLADLRADGLDRLALDHPPGAVGVMEVVATFTRPV